MFMSKQIISIICGNRDKFNYVRVSIAILDYLLRIMAGELSVVDYPRWTPGCRSIACMSVPSPCPWEAARPSPPPRPRVRGCPSPAPRPPCPRVAPAPVSLGGQPYVSRLLALSAVGAPRLQQQGLSGRGGESAAKRDRGRLSPWGAPPSVGTEGETSESRAWARDVAPSSGTLPSAPPPRGAAASLRDRGWGSCKCLGGALPLYFPSRAPLWGVCVYICQ